MPQFDNCSRAIFQVNCANSISVYTLPPYRYAIQALNKEYIIFFFHTILVQVTKHGKIRTIVLLQTMIDANYKLAFSIFRSGQIWTIAQTIKC